MRIKIVKDKRRIATAEKFVQHQVGGDVVDSLFFFHRISLEPPIMFEHLAGTGLTGFLDRSRLVIENDGEKLIWHDLRYVHGRSEALKGEHDVTSVLLAYIKPGVQVNELEWIGQLPDIYQNFLKTLK